LADPLLAALISSVASSLCLGVRSYIFPVV